jgi:glycosyltransferase involved in cell wall biosynthesis
MGVIHPVANARKLRLCYFGGYRLTYPRHKFYAAALSALGVEVLECNVSHKLPTVQRSWALWQKFWHENYQADVLLVDVFNHGVVPVAWLIAKLKGIPLAFDPGLSQYDEAVLTLKKVTPGSLHGRYLWLRDWLAYRLPDLVVWFTPVDMEFFGQMFGIAPEKNSWVAPGIDPAIYNLIPMPPFQKPLVVHFDGNIAPTHGVDIILRAAALLSPEDFRFEIIGGGQVDDVRARAAELQLQNVSIPGYVSDEEMRASMERAHICLGAFRADDKLRRSLYTKEIQALLSGRPLVTGIGEAKARFFENGRDLIMVEPENPTALAEALRTLRDHPDRLITMAQNAYQAGNRLLSPQNTSEKLLNLLNALVKRRQGVVGQKPDRPL